MATFSTIKIRNSLLPQKDSGEVYSISANYPLSATLLDNGDRAYLMTFQRAGIILGGSAAVLATLGASATVKVQHANAAFDTFTDLTALTTAGGASRVQFTRLMRFAAGDSLVLLSAGADFASATTLELDLSLAHNPVLAAVSIQGAS